MNERIKQLAEQAGYTKDMFGVGHWDMPECKKFAELIVKECASKADSILRMNQVEYIATGAGGGTMGDVILEHFGVEE
jgi:hypothetical protein